MASPLKREDERNRYAAAVGAHCSHRGHAIVARGQATRPLSSRVRRSRRQLRLPPGGTVRVERHPRADIYHRCQDWHPGTKVTASHSSLDPNLYSEALEQQWALVHDIMSPTGAWLAFVDGPKIAQAQAVSRGEQDMAGYVAATIGHAQPFFWRASIARVIVKAVQTLPDYTFTAESFPCPKGFVWFEEPIQLEDGDSEHAPLRCFAWSVLDHRHDREGVPVLLYAYSSAQPRRAGVPTIESTIRLGWTLSEVVERRAASMLANPVSRAQLDPLPYRDRTGGKRWSVREEPGPPAEEVIGLTRAFYQFVAGCLSFLEQRIAIAVHRPVSRGARRRVEHQRPLTEPASAVGVIELRRREHRDQDDDASHGSVGPAWQCQWIVSGHWRRQYYPASNAHKPRYIAPYVKGPADKPLKAPAGAVFAVTR